MGSPHRFNYNSIKVTSHKFILTKPCALFIFTDGVMPSHPLGLLLCIFQCGSKYAVSYKGLRDEATEQSLQNQKLFYMLSASGRVCRSVTEERTKAEKEMKLHDSSERPIMAETVCIDLEIKCRLVVQMNICLVTCN